MSELIKITNRGNEQVVSARELHKFLETTEKFEPWFKRLLEFGFVENQDYSTIFTQLTDNQEVPKSSQSLSINELRRMNGSMLRAKGLQRDYAMVLDMSKEVSMLARNEKGKIARKHFIASDKRRIELEKAATPKVESYEEVMLKALQMADEKVKMLIAEAEENKPKLELYGKAIEYNDQWVTVAELAGLMKIIGPKGKVLGRNGVFKYLRRAGMMYNTQPMQSYILRNWFAVKVSESGEKFPIVAIKNMEAIKKKIEGFVELDKLSIRLEKEKDEVRKDLGYTV